MVRCEVSRRVPPASLIVRTGAYPSRMSDGVMMLCMRARGSSGFFFFFQAEDGIRDYKVTGVQTCALPICQHGSAGNARGGEDAERLVHGCEALEPAPDQVAKRGPVLPARVRRGEARVLEEPDRKSVV